MTTTMNMVNMLHSHGGEAVELLLSGGHKIVGKIEPFEGAPEAVRVSDGRPNHWAVAISAIVAVRRHDRTVAAY